MAAVELEKLTFATCAEGDLQDDVKINSDVKKWMGRKFTLPVETKYYYNTDSAKETAIKNQLSIKILGAILETHKSGNPPFYFERTEVVTGGKTVLVSCLHRLETANIKRYFFLGHGATKGSAYFVGAVTPNDASGKLIEEEILKHDGLETDKGQLEKFVGVFEKAPSSSMFSFLFSIF